MKFLIKLLIIILIILILHLIVYLYWAFLINNMNILEWDSRNKEAIVLASLGINTIILSVTPIISDIIDLN